MPPWPELAGLNLIRILLALGFLFGLLPLAFPRPQDPGTNPVLARGLLMAFGAITGVHLLIPLRLYGVPGFLTAIGLAVLVGWVQVLSWPAIGRMAASAPGRFMSLVEEADRPLNPGSQSVRLPLPALPRWWPARLALLAGVLAVSAWVRFQPVLARAAPPFSDAPVHLAWVKYLALPSLYRDEVYPRGMHIISSLVHRFAGLNPIEANVLLGPLFGTLIVLAAAYFMYQMTGSLGAATVTALVYGTLPDLLPTGDVFGRQVGMNAHEFGLIWVLPAVWFTFVYLARGRTADRAAAAAAAGLTAYAHPMPVLFTVLTMAAAAGVAVAAWGSQARRRLPGLMLWVGGAGVIAALPLAVATLSGQRWHQSSVNYLYKALAVDAPPITPAILGAVVVAVALLPGGLTAARLRPTERDAWMARAAVAAVVLVGMGFFFLPFLGVQSKPLLERGRDLPALGVALAAGLAWSVGERPLRRLPGLSVLLTAVLVGGAWWGLPPRPAMPAHYVFGHEEVEQYLRADRSMKPGTWTLVTGPTGYSLAVGRSFHMYPADFVRMADQLPADSRNWVQASKALNYGISAHYVLFVQKVVPAVPGREADAAAIQAESLRLQEWINQAAARLPITQVYAGEELAVWHLAVPAARED